MDLTTISTAAAALVLRPDSPDRSDSENAEASRRLRRVIIGAFPEVATWLDGGAAADAEQIHCLVDLVRTGAEKDLAFRGAVVGAVRSAGGAPAESLHGLGAYCGTERYWDTASWCYRNAEALFRARGDAVGAARCRADLEALRELRGRTVERDAGYDPSGARSDAYPEAAAVLG